MHRDRRVFTALLGGTAVAVVLVFATAISAASTASPPARSFLTSWQSLRTTEPGYVRPVPVQGWTADSLPAAGAGRVRVVIESASPSAAGEAVEAAGGHVERTWRNLVQATVPRAGLSALKREESVELVRAPMTMLPDAVGGEEVGVSLASAWHAKAFTGKDVKVAVIDGGFVGLADRQASGDLPAGVVTQDICGGQFNTATEHGTAVAEIVHEMAPDAQLYLVCIDTEVDLASAVAYAKAQGVHVISHSASWFGPVRGDGSGYFGALVADARAAGILWVNSAGNYAQTHWSGTFVSPDGGPSNEFVPGDHGNSFWLPSGADICGFLRWDEWPTATSDFDLLLVKTDTMQLVDASDGSQTGTQPAVEAICGRQTSGSTWPVAWYVYGYAVRSNPRIDLFAFGPNLEHQTPAGSLLDPATSSAALAVGALCWQSKAPEAYSSQGPTIDGRMKPDIAGHDSVSSATYGGFTACGTSGFAGTSAAAPEVAGAAALVKQAYPAYGVDQLQQALTKNVVDVAPGGPDNVTGAGELRLTVPDTGPSIGAPAATPARPTAGKPFTVVFPVTRRYDGAPLTTGTMDCAPKVSGKTLKHEESLADGKAKLAMVIPSTAKGQQLKVTVKITANGSSATKVATYKIR